MAKGQAQAAQNQLNSNNQVAAGQGANAQQTFGVLAPNLTQQLNNPGYNQATQSAILGQGMEAANQPFNSAMQEAKDTAARTGNSAGLDTSLDSMARAKAAADSNAAQTGNIAIANDAQKQEAQAQSGLNSLFGVSDDTMAKLYGNAPGLLQARAAGGPSPLMGLAQSAIGAAGTAACWIARAVYGEDDPRPKIIAHVWWHEWVAESYLARILLAFYLILGEPIGAVVKRSRILRKLFRPVFDRALAKAVNG